MKLLSWNVNKRWPVNRTGNRIAKIKSEKPDIVTLQEVMRNRADDWADALKGIDLDYHYRSGNNALTLSHQCLIASRWKLTPNDIPKPREPPYPESLGRATVSVPDEGDIDVFTAHIPNGSGNGWRKIDTYHVLAAELLRASDSPCILTGDFNEPKLFRESGEIVTFGGRPTGRWRDKFGDERPSIEWADGVRSVLDEAKSEHGLRDAYRDKNGIQPTDLFTWRKRCFDHTFVSRHFRVEKCGYYHEWREELGLSDHSPMWVELGFRADRPD